MYDHLKPWLPYDLYCYHVTVMWLVLLSCDHHMTHVAIMWLSCDPYCYNVTVMWPMLLSCDCHVTHVAIMWLSCDRDPCCYHVTVMWPSLTTYPRTVLFSWQSSLYEGVGEWVELWWWVLLLLCLPHLLLVEYIATNVTPPIENTTHITCRSDRECVNNNRVATFTEPSLKHSKMIWCPEQY